MFTNLMSQFERNQGGQGERGTSGVFTISDSALAQTAPLSLPTLNKPFPLGNKTAMLDNIIKKLQSDDEDQPDNDGNLEEPLEVKYIKKRSQVLSSRSSLAQFFL